MTIYVPYKLVTSYDHGDMKPFLTRAPLEDVAAGVDEGPDEARLRLGDDLEHLDVLHDGVVVVYHLLRGDDAVAHGEDGDGAVRLPAPYLHVRGRVGLDEAVHGVEAINRCARCLTADLSLTWSPSGCRWRCRAR